MRNKKCTSLFLTFLIASLTITPVYASATQKKITEAEQQKTETQSNLNASQDKISSLEAKKGDLEAYLTELNQQLTDLSKNLSDLQEKSDAKQAELQQIEKELDDAKARREEQYESMKLRIQYMYGYAGPARIDEINILQATYEAMREAVSKLTVRPQILLNDAVTIPQMDIPQVPIIKGDAKSISIAAASIIAKVTRDRLMREYDKVMPEYGFASHKGYGAASHIEAIRKYGPSPIHRATFIRNFID